MSPVLLLAVTLSTLESLTCLTRSENWGCAPGGLLLLKTAHTRTTRHKMISQSTAFLTLEFMKSPTRCYLNRMLKRLETLLKTMRKTECGVKQFLICLAVRAAPFALLRETI